jgi:hypothetical protein
MLGFSQPYGRSSRNDFPGNKPGRNPALTDNKREVKQMPAYHRSQYINQGVPAVSVRGEDCTTSICGTAAADDCILRFDTNATVGGGQGIADGTAAATGTLINITRAGIYFCQLVYAATAGGTINNIGISMNTDAAGRAGDPAMATVGILNFASVLSPAATNVSTELTAVAVVTKALAAATAVIRFHAGDGANATPAAGDLTEAECRFSVVLISNII